MTYKCAANGCEFTSLVAADMKRHMALEHVLIVKNADGTGTNVIRRSCEIEAQKRRSTDHFISRQPKWPNNSLPSIA